MLQCLFCLQEGEGDAVRFTYEHVFPAALGGNLVVKHGTCDKCNHGNSKFEQAIAIELTLAYAVPNISGFPQHTEGLALSFDSKNLNMTSVINFTSPSVLEYWQVRN